MTRSTGGVGIIVLTVAILGSAPPSSMDVLAGSGSSLATALTPRNPENGRFVDNASEPFGTFGGVDFIRHTGRFVGTTSLGDFRVPYEIVAPADPELGSGTVLVEAPHWAFAPVGRDLILGRDLIFGRGISYASVGYGTDGGEILDASATGAVIADEPVETPGVVTFAGIFDEEILIQFVETLTYAPLPVRILGPVIRIYAYGQSRSADALVVALDRLSGTGGSDLFDLWRLTATTSARGSAASSHLHGLSARCRNGLKGPQSPSHRHPAAKALAEGRGKRFPQCAR